ncbi:hypothetical protein CYY_006425 [Polysphondylium violaceum]|uniref:rRNA adenine N(6)-methyltransferase n=1 Tax=Polysphondylium violaceum TaxID=133409 RepID=A0A8J4PS50_9MYCE|nr:hypothetical protein CYY_006425 [Polysphondylium violaceum]
MSKGLPPMPKIQELIRLYGLSAKQQLSQNFLLDLNITSKICKLAGGFKDCTVIEVGAGPGGLTRSILAAGAKKVIAVEMDPRFYPALKMLEEASEGRLSIVMANMMDVDEAQILSDYRAEKTAWPQQSKVKLIGNLPFNVGTHLMLKWLRQIQPQEGLYQFGRVPLYLMFQKELSDRIAAPIGTHDYTRLSVMVQQLYQPKIIYEVPRKVFVPAPKVDASVIALEPRIKPIGDVQSPEYFEYVCREIFTQKRKVLSNGIKILGPNAEKDLLEGINVNLRPQNVTIEDFVKIANRFTAWEGKKKNIDLLEFKNQGKSLRKDQKQEQEIVDLQNRMKKIKTKLREKEIEKQEKKKQKDLELAQALAEIDNEPDEMAQLVPKDKQKATQHMSTLLKQSQEDDQDEYDQLFDDEKVTQEEHYQHLLDKYQDQIDYVKESQLERAHQKEIIKQNRAIIDTTLINNNNNNSKKNNNKNSDTDNDFDQLLLDENIDYEALLNDIDNIDINDIKKNY